MQISLGEFLTRISNNPAKIFWPVVGYLTVYMKYFRWQRPPVNVLID